MEFAGLISVLDVASVIGALTAVAVARITPNVAVWAYDKVTDWFADHRS